MSVNLFSITKHGHFARCMTILSIAFVLASADAGFLMAQQSDAPDSPKPENLADTNTPRAGVLALIDGSQVPGQLRSSSNPDVLQWLANGFVTPFQFRSEAIESIKFPRIRNTELNTDSDEFAIEFTNRDIVYGNIISWIDGLLTISTDTCGELIVPADSITRLYRVQENETLLFTRFNGLAPWNKANLETNGWQESGNFLATQQRGAVLNGDLGVPLRAVIEITLSWKDQADFTLSLGSDVTATEDLPIDGWRLETAGQKLVAVRESDQAATLSQIADLTLRRDLRLTFYLDQVLGQMHVMRKDGKLLTSLKMPKNNQDGNPAPTSTDTSESQTHQRGIRIINRGTNLTVERISVARWLGDLPNPAVDADALVALDDGTFAAGSIESMLSGDLVIGQINPKARVDWKRVTGITFRKPKAPPPPAACAIFLQNGIRLSGNIVEVDQRHCIFASTNGQAASKIPREHLRSIIVFKHENKPPAVAADGEIEGQLQIADLKLTGILSPSDAKTGQTPAMAFQWKAFGSQNAAKMRPDVAGSVLYRKKPDTDPKNPQQRAQEMARLRLRQQQRGLNFGELFLKRADELKSPKAERDAHVVHIRTGDIISCRVDRIDEQGVHVSTIDSDDGFVSHAEIKAIEFVANAPPPDLEAAKRERLLTIPRLQKTAPPTHLLCSHNGDFLRCRLINADASRVRVEVQLTEIELPRERIAQIIWLHPVTESSENADTSPQADTSDQPEGKQPATSIFDGVAQVLLRDGKRVTFTPNSTTRTHVSGESSIIGPCSFPLETVDQLILGNQILTEVTDLAYNRWKLQSAIEPLVTAAMEQGDNINNVASPLVGEPAPEVALQMLDGTAFKLSEQKGKIVVLDFWATWCAPCMQTMPLVEKAVKQFDPEQVKLVSVNLQESAQQIQPVLERYQLNVSVALDIDGVAAARYEAKAIPQLVIVGSDGVVKQLYVGGGSKVVDQMSEAIQTLLDQQAPR